jgi:hypothetical protein
MRHFAAVGIVVVLVATLGATCTASNTTNGTVTVNVNAAEDIIYGTNMDPAVVEASRSDCQERGGTFNECGSACTPGQMCIAACALRCDF